MNLPAALAADLDGSFEPLVLAYQNQLYAWALRLSGSPADAEEITQDTFVRAYQALVRYPSERVRTMALRPWLHQITLNVFRNRRRHHQPLLLSLDQEREDGAVEPEADDGRHPDQALEDAEIKATLATLITALPERYRAPVLLRHMQGLGYGEMAVVLKQPIGTIKANVHRGVRLLRQGLEAKEPTTMVHLPPQARRRKT